MIGNGDKSSLFRYFLKIFFIHFDRHSQGFDQSVQKSFGIIAIYIGIQLVDFIQPHDIHHQLRHQASAQIPPKPIQL